jgi:hypothetical protein
MYFKVKNARESQVSLTLPLTCPHCGQKSSLGPVDSASDIQFAHEGFTKMIAGPRVCPNPDCKALIFFLYAEGKDSWSGLTFPRKKMQFKKENIPKEVLDVFEEAIECQANDCYVAAGILVRRTLEEVCKERGAVGNSLAERIQDLKAKIALQPELFEGLEELRLLGNDAAHVEAKNYKNIGAEGTESALMLTAEILRAIYQIRNFVDNVKKFRKDTTP